MIGVARNRCSLVYSLQLAQIEYDLCDLRWGERMKGWYARSADAVFHNALQCGVGKMQNFSPLRDIWRPLSSPPVQPMATRAIRGEKLLPWIR